MFNAHILTPVSIRIKGWNYAFEDISLGEKVIVHIPAALSYGKRGVPEDEWAELGGLRSIPPCSSLSFSIHCVGIDKGPKLKLPPVSQEEKQAARDSWDVETTTATKRSVPNKKKTKGRKKR